MSAKNFLGLKYLRKIKKNFFNKFQNFLDPKNFLWFWVQTQNPNPKPKPNTHRDPSQNV